MCASHARTQSPLAYPVKRETSGVDMPPNPAFHTARRPAYEAPAFATTMNITHSGVAAAAHEPASEQVKPELLVLTERQIKNFWAKVDKAGPIPLQRPELGPCWLWTGGTIKGGYGRVRIGERLYLAHRVSHGISKFKIPDDKLGCHECDNPRCVNDAHIFVGTHADNA